MCRHPYLLRRNSFFSPTMNFFRDPRLGRECSSCYQDIFSPFPTWKTCQLASQSSSSPLLFATRREILFDLPYYVVCSRYVVEAVSKRFQIGPLKLATGSDLDCVMLTPLKRKSAERAIDFPPVCKPGSLFSSSSPHPQVYIYTHTHTHRVSVTNCPRTFSSLAL